MRCRSWLRVTTILAMAMAAIWMGCSEDEPVEVDQRPPQVSLVNPDVGQGLNISPVEVVDSIVIVVDAEDPSGIEKVEFWITFHDETSSRKLGESTTPFEPNPNAGQPGSGLYKYTWSVSGITTGSTGFLWAMAYDRLGNAGRATNPASIRVISSNVIGPPIADFTVTFEGTGTVADVFFFDPTLTTDPIDELDRIKVRWDFNYEPPQPPTWDIDTTDARAGDVVEHQFAQPGTYTIALQAFNTYWNGPSNIATRDWTVLPEFGTPRPQGPVVMIPKGTYPVGVPSVDGRRNPNPYSENEIVYRDSIIPGTTNTIRVPAKLFITLSTNLFIDQYEVTNDLYVKFLNKYRVEGKIAYESNTNSITLVETGAELITLASDLTRIFYVDEEVGFSVEASERNFPVTGVTWQGAKSYCSEYGLRLPTEYEWEIAARLGRQIATTETGYLYPWTPDTEINGAYGNYRDSGDPYEASSNLRAENPVASYSDIDSLMGTWAHENAVGPVGTYDQAGNVAEWVDDWYVPGVYRTLRAKYDAQGRWPVDPQSPKQSESLTGTRVIRGGSFFDSAAFLRVTRREARDPLVGSATIGFRGVYTEFNPE